MRLFPSTACPLGERLTFCTVETYRVRILGHSLAIKARMSLMKQCQENSIMGLNFRDNKKEFTVSADTLNGRMLYEYPFDAAVPCDNAVNDFGFLCTIIFPRE